MAFQKKIGNLPILASVYNVNMPTGNVISNYGVNVVQALTDAGYTDDASRINAIHTYGKAATTGAGSNQIIIPCKPSASLTPAQETAIELYNTEDTGTLCRIKYKANVILGYSETGSGLNIYTSFPYYDFFGVAIYHDALGAELVGVQICAAYFRSNLQNIYYDNAYGSISIADLKARGYDITIISSDPDYGEESQPDGYGNDGTHPAFDFHSEEIPIPQPPAVSSATVGFYNIYKVTTGTLNNLGEYLFPVIDWDTITDPTKALRAIAGMFAYRDSIQYIVDLHSIPVDPSAGAATSIRIGNLNAEDITAPKVNNDYVDFDCGTVSIPLNYKNALDFMTNASLFLPFVGFIDVKPEMWNGGALNVKYRFNVVDGSFMCYVRASSGVSALANSVIGQYSGSACIHFPVVANSYGSIVGGLMQTAQALSKPATPLNAVGALETAATAYTVQPPMQSSNAYNASSAYLGGRRPYLMIEYPTPCMSSGYPHEHGFPLNVNMAFGNLHGYTEIDENVDLSGINAPVDVLDDIRKALTTGTIF